MSDVFNLLTSRQLSNENEMIATLKVHTKEKKNYSNLLIGTGATQLLNAILEHLQTHLHAQNDEGFFEMASEILDVLDRHETGQYALLDKWLSHNEVYITEFVKKQPVEDGQKQEVPEATNEGSRPSLIKGQQQQQQRQEQGEEEDAVLTDLEKHEKRLLMTLYEAGVFDEIDDNVQNNEVERQFKHEIVEQFQTRIIETIDEKIEALDARIKPMRDFWDNAISKSQDLSQYGFGLSDEFLKLDASSIKFILKNWDDFAEAILFRRVIDNDITSLWSSIIKGTISTETTYQNDTHDEHMEEASSSRPSIDEQVRKSYEKYEQASVKRMESPARVKMYPLGSQVDQKIKSPFRSAFRSVRQIVVDPNGTDEDSSSIDLENVVLE